MEVGDRFVVNGVVNQAAGIVRINLANNQTNDIAIHMRADIHLNRFIWDSFINGQWTGQEHSPLPYRAGQPYEVSMELTQTTFEINFNGNHLYSYRKRTPSYHQTSTAQLFGTHTTNWIELVCKNSPVTPTRPPRPPRPSPGRPPRPGHGGGNGYGGHGHGRRYDDNSSGSSSSSDESC
ncbi:hypothetical protein CAEBREN_21294 [Caenorhabditis brenneri]|uniref:Galectin n=1 Tax=Caenorhabditis brenneri TaxID=135651 RepID=G0P2N5_CAEBE|nr:hypothetical protein CAEBREN_21294 [Caenorhabditis brenneri]